MLPALRLTFIRALLPAFIFCAFIQPAYAQTQVSGYLKSFLVVQDQIDNPFIKAPVSYQLQNSGRLMVEHFTPGSVWQFHYEVSPVLLSNSLGDAVNTFNPVTGNYRLTDPPNSFNEDTEKNRIYQNLDRFNVQFQFDAGDLTIGRQAISLGSARIINPTDVFLPFDVRTFNTEYRTGVDAIRFQRPIGDLGEIDIGVVLGEDADHETSAAFLQLRGNLGGKDLHFALIEFAEHTLVGAGIETAIGDMGFWFEAASVAGDANYVRLSTGLDYAFSENTFMMVEFHHNGAGADDSDDYLSLFGKTAYQRGGVFLLGQDYLIPSFSIQFSPLWRTSIQALLNLDDHSAFVSLSAEYNVHENFYMDFGYYHFTGRDLGITPLGQPDFRSEYGPNPDTFYTSIRWYF